MNQIGDAVVFYKEIDGGHTSFLVGNDMSYFKEDVIDLLAEYHPLPVDNSSLLTSGQSEVFLI